MKISDILKSAKELKNLHAELKSIEADKKARQV